MRYYIVCDMICLHGHSLSSFCPTTLMYRGSGRFLVHFIDTVYNLHFYFLIFYNLELFRTSYKYTIDFLFFNFALFIIKCKKYNYFTIFLHKSNPISVY